jgi:hypothetical protein
MVNEIKTYSTKETAEILGIKERAVQTRCKKYNIRKKDNKYLITDLIIADWKQKEEANAKPNANANATQIEDLENQLKDLKDEALLISSKHKYAEQMYLTAIDKYEEEIKELKEELSGYEITENERLEVFTNEEYQLFQTRLIEWQTQQKDNEHQQELFNVKVLTLEQSAEHYKNSYFYQRKQNERFIDMHEKLLDTIQLSGKEGFIKSVVEAKTTDWKK